MVHADSAVGQVGSGYREIRRQNIRDPEPALQREGSALTNSRRICLRSSRQAAHWARCMSVCSSSNFPVASASAINAAFPGQPVRSGFGCAVWTHRSKESRSSASPGSRSIGKSDRFGPDLKFAELICHLPHCLSSGAHSFGLSPAVPREYLSKMNFERWQARFLISRRFLSSHALSLSCRR